MYCPKSCCIQSRAMLLHFSKVEMLLSFHNAALKEASYVLKQLQSPIYAHFFFLHLTKNGQVSS